MKRVQASRTTVLTVCATALFLLLLMMYFIRILGQNNLVVPGISSAVSLGFVLIAAYLSGKLAKMVKLPGITGYLVAGMIFGPYVLNFITSEGVEELQLLDNLALGLIALSAGGELRLKKLRSRMKTISYVTFFQVGFVFLGMTAVMFLVSLWLPPFRGNSMMVLLAVSLLAGATCTANSPATVIAVITETRSKGSMTDVVLGVTILKDVAVIVLFAFVLSISRILVKPDVPFDFSFVLTLFLEIAGSILAGVLLGWLIYLYLKYVNAELVLFVLAIAFLSMEFSRIHFKGPVEVSLSGLLVCVTAGFFVENFSREGPRFIHALEKGSLPIYVVFFAITGAALNLNALKEMWLLALILVAGRAAATFGGTWLGVKAGGGKEKTENYAWMAFVAQAGVTIGLAVLISQRFPQWGNALATLVVASLAVNQLIGPPLFRYALVKTDEAGE